MHKICCKLFVSILIVFLAPVAVKADIIKLKDGHVHRGVVTAEEDQRVQIRLEGSGARIWFSRDQIASIKKSKPQGEEQVNQNSSVQPAVPEDEEMARARDLLKKIRRQSDESKNKKKKNKKNSVEQAEPEPPTVVASNAAPDEEVQRLIGVLREGQIYDRRNACVELAELDAQEAVPDLIQALDDDNSLVRGEANKALIKITGQDFKYNASHHRSLRVEAQERWEKWYKTEKSKEGREQFKDQFKALW